MKPRLESERDTHEDADIWVRLLMRQPRQDSYLRFTMWSMYREADRRDAYLMLCLGCTTSLGAGPRARVLDTLTVEELFAVYSKDRGKVYIPEATYPTSHKRQ